MDSGRRWASRCSSASRGSWGGRGLRGSERPGGGGGLPLGGLPSMRCSGSRWRDYVRACEECAPHTCMRGAQSGFKC
eukprot:1750191-Prymnesium_polylepis.1